jgi:hypothetical protein
MDSSTLDYISISFSITYCEDAVFTQGFVEEYSLDAPGKTI